MGFWEKLNKGLDVAFAFLDVVMPSEPKKPKERRHRVFRADHCTCEECQEDREINPHE